MASNGKTIFENTTGLTRHCVLYPEYNENDPKKVMCVGICHVGHGLDEEDRSDIDTFRERKRG